MFVIVFIKINDNQTDICMLIHVLIEYVSTACFYVKTYNKNILANWAYLFDASAVIYLFNLIMCFIKQ